MIWMVHMLERRAAKVLAGWLLVLLLGPLPVFSQAPPPSTQAQPSGQAQQSAPKPFTPEELEQIAAPVALYSDSLLAHVLMASTYPLEVVQAARFMKANPKLKDQALNEALQKQDWDDSVKFIVSVPQALSMMDEKLDWMQKLGDSFLDQRKELMDAVQRLRAKAQSAGNLKSTPEQTVRVEPAAPATSPPPAPPAPSGAPAPAPTQQTIIIEQANPQTVYVPTYNPAVVYGAWPYPAYPPYAYYPPGYVAGAAITFGVGMAVGAAMWGGSNWGGGDVDIDVNKNNNFNQTVNRGDRQTQRTNVQGGDKQSFQHNPEHRKGAQYRDSGTQQKYNKQGPAGSQGREDFRGRGSEGAQTADRGGRGDTGRGGGPSTSDVSRPGGGDRGGGPSTSDVSRQGGGDRGGGSGGGAFQGMDRGGDARASSQRGESSLGASSRGGGGQSMGASSSGGASRSGGGGSRSGGGGSRGGGGGRGGRR
jgi:hypothetical protein